MRVTVEFPDIVTASVAAHAVESALSRLREKQNPVPFDATEIAKLEKAVACLAEGFDQALRTVQA